MITTPTLDPADTICAIATPAGTGGIAVVRVSGPQATTVVERLWQGASLRDMTSHTAHLGVVTTFSGETLDQVVLTLFRAPHSYTGDDIVEIACHGSVWIQQRLLEALIDAGARLATAGEFTRRAFAAGRIDLSQAEAIGDLIAAHSAASHRVAMNQMRGGFARQLDNLRERLLHFVAMMELELDFSEEDVTFADRSQLNDLAGYVLQRLNALADTFSQGQAIKNGLPVAIVGQTNAGKSTLLNALLHDDRAIVSDIAGTTRDTIEDTISLHGTLLRFIDTAGIRHSDDTIENIGIERSIGKMQQAQIVLWVIDGTASAQSLLDTAASILPHCAEAHVIALINKADVAPLIADIETATRQQLEQYLPQAAHTVLTICAHDNDDIARVQQTIADAISPSDGKALASAIGEDDVVVTNVRHYEALTAAAHALEQAINALQAGVSTEFVTQDIRETLHHMATITGAITTDDTLNHIFSSFCIGK